MPRDKIRIALNALIGLIIVTAVSTLAYLCVPKTLSRFIE